MEGFDSGNMLYTEKKSKANAIVSAQTIFFQL